MTLLSLTSTISLVLSILPLTTAQALCPTLTTTAAARLCPYPSPAPPATPTTTYWLSPTCSRLACLRLASVSVPCGCPTTVPTSTYYLPCTSPGPCPGDCVTSWSTILPVTRCPTTTASPSPTTTTTKPTPTSSPCSAVTVTVTKFVTSTGRCTPLPGITSL